MKTFSIALLGIALIFGVLEATDAGIGVSGTKHFKLNHKVGENSLKFISNAPVEDIEGTVQKDKISGWAKIDASNLEKSTGEISFKVMGMETGIDTRDEHLYSPTWLNAEKYPEIKFKMMELANVKIKSSGSGKSMISADAKGTFMMHGEEKEMTIPLELTYLKESDATKKRADGDLLFAEGKFTVALADFNVTGKEGIVGSKVGKEIKIEFKLFFNGN